MFRQEPRSARLQTRRLSQTTSRVSAVAARRDTCEDAHNGRMSRAGITGRTRPGPLAQARNHMDAATAASHPREAVRHLLAALGSASFSTAGPVQRIWRDMEVALSHSNITPDPNREAYGRALLGLTGSPTG
ncbi:hypothetical protein [Streptomyces sp. NPDC001315]|uniref:hypothetical protein n=1 Tax=Streptomyces sp. NPDC001315 TaxID=3364562 RepID=UPI0036881213